MNLSEQSVLIHKTKSDIESCLLRDQYRLSSALKALLKNGKDCPEQWTRLIGNVDKSLNAAQQRAAALPIPTFPVELPVVGKLEVIKAAIETNQVVIVAGETGSGKTTQIPKICLALGRGVRGMIGHTQPRRIAARSVANRIAEELHGEVGGIVGYKVRFSDQVSSTSLIKILTDGMLLAETQQDRFLENYDTLIIDEAHERSLNIDFLLGYLKRLLPKRRDLKVIITSATLDHQRFADFFDNAPVIEVSGRTYPVEVIYQPLINERHSGDSLHAELLDADSTENSPLNSPLNSGSKGNPSKTHSNSYLDDNEPEPIDINQGLFKAINRIRKMRPNLSSTASSSTANGILAFFSGEREIRDAANYLRKKNIKGLEIVPLYARLSIQEQNKVFQDYAGQRIILATNVAETSLTVPNIGYVIDTGLVRISRYSYRTKTQRLPIESISQASANQRKGRCGRISEGVCIRLYSEEDFSSRPEFTDPEILRTNLAAVILQLKLLKLGDIGSFPFLDAPDQRLVNDGHRLLQELEAIDLSKKITVLGRKLARFPIDPKLSRMVLAAHSLGALREVLIVVSGLSVQDPRERPHDKAQQADEVHRQWSDKKSDFLSFVNLWEHLEEQRQELSNNQFTKYLKANFVSPLRYREWRDVHRQLRLQCKEMSMKETNQSLDYALLHQSLLQGLLSNVGFQEQPREFVGARNRKFRVFPGSSLAKKPPKWLMAAEVVETSKVYARTVAQIDTLWLENAAKHLLKKSYSEPHWSRKRSDVMVYEQASLHGLVIYDKRLVPYGPIDPQQSRDLFIRCALVEQEYSTAAKFYQHNSGLIQDIQLLEHKTRRKDLMVDDQTVYDFYDKRISSSVFNGKSFDAWRRKLEKSQPAFLYLNEADLLLKPEVKAQQARNYPDSMKIDGIELRLEYEFNPGTQEDGVVLVVPVGVLHQVERGITSWLVPGMLREKCMAMLKALPKSLRKNFVPIPNFVDAVLARSMDKTQAIEEELAKHLADMTGVQIPSDVWQDLAWDKHLFMHYKVVDKSQQVLAVGDDLREIKQTLSGRAAQVIKSSSTESIERKGVKSWDFGELPDVVDLTQNQQAVRAFPALADHNSSVSIELFESPHQAITMHSKGLARLYSLQLSQSVRYLKKQFKQQKKLPFLYLASGNVDEFADQFVLSVIQEVFQTQADPVRSAQAFEKNLAAGKVQLNEIAAKKQALLLDTFNKFQAINLAIDKQKKPVWKPVINDLKAQLQCLFNPEFLWETPSQWLARYPYYLRSMELRLERLPSNEAKYEEECAVIQRLQKEYDRQCGRYSDNSAKLAQLSEVPWLIEELRLSFFSQSIKTVVSVSEKRILKKLHAV